MRLFPGVKLGIGPAITDGFYYDFLLERPLTPEDLASIEAEMAKSIAANHTFKLDEHAFDDARAKLVKLDQTFKVEIMDDLATKAAAAGQVKPNVTTYTHGEFQDLCRGPHVESTGKIGPYKLLSIAGAYWRGKSDRPMLQRIYGTAWDTQEELDQFIWRRDEMKKRDHRRLGVALDLFSFHDVSPGSAFWHPKGQLLWRTLEGAMRELQDARGYQEISTPIIVSKRLWEQSGHWELYRENMFIIESEGEQFSLKPMNCPESTVIYKTKTRSYRDLPLRLAEYGRLHRNELSGTLSGLTRVRHFIQDDGHIYVRPDQIESEIDALLGEVATVYGWFDLPVELVFSTKPAKALGDPKLWEKAEAMIESALKRSGAKWRLNAGDGAFYAPKIDIIVRDALGREWQTATIQVDLAMLPERFNLEYVDEAGSVSGRSRFTAPSTVRLSASSASWWSTTPAHSPSGSHLSRSSSSRSLIAMKRRPPLAPQHFGPQGFASPLMRHLHGCRTRFALRRSRRFRLCLSSVIRRSRRAGPPLAGVTARRSRQRVGRRLPPHSPRKPPRVAPREREVPSRLKVLRLPPPWKVSAGSDTDDREGVAD